MRLVICTLINNINALMDRGGEGQRIEGYESASGERNGAYVG